MKKSFMICLAIAEATFANACTDNAIDYGCKEGATECNSGNLYTCEKGIKGTYWKETKCDFGCFENNGIAKCYECDLNDGDKLQKCENSIIYKCEKSSDSNSNKGTWKPLETCVNRCDNNTDIFKSKCQCRDSCVNGCTTDGSCLPVDKCSKTDETGACISCVNGVDNKNGTCIYPECVLKGDEYKLDDGKCQPLKECAQPDETGACVCANDLKKHNLDGSCDCSSFCVNGCDANGICQPASEECKYNHDEKGNCICTNDLINNTNGTCDCSNFCVNGCDATGICHPATEGCIHDEQGKCKCLNGRDENTGRCIDTCKNGSTFNPANGQCSCPEACDSKCYPDGSCITATSCKDDAECKEKYDYCDGTSRDKTCYCDKQNNYCSPIDMNHNNMKDQLEHLSWNTIDCFYKADKKETVGNREAQDKYCKTEVEKLEANESSKLNPAQSFCDSFIDYHCALKCSSDDQCLDGFICRKETEGGDGRCAADSFTTVWSSALRTAAEDTDRTLELKSSSTSCDIYVCWDWKKGGKTIEKYKEDGLAQPDAETLGKYPEFEWATCPEKFEHITECETFSHTYDKTTDSENADNITVKVYGYLDGFSVSSSGEYKECDLERGYEYFQLDKTSSKPKYDCFKSEGTPDSIIGTSTNCKTETNDNCRHLIATKIEEENINGYLVECIGCIHNAGPSRSNLIEIQSFGRVGLGWHRQDLDFKDYYDIANYRGAFHDCYHLRKLPSVDIPNPHILDMTDMFRGNCLLDSALEQWDVSRVSSMRRTFMFTNCQPGNNGGGRYIDSNHPILNTPLEKWDVSNVKTMANMFGGSPFNRTINNWDVSNVTDMAGMFGCNDNEYLYNHFNQGLSAWNVSNVKRMSNMFLRAKYFDQDLSAWNVSNVNDMNNMFRGATSFNNDNKNISKWNISKVTNMERMFEDATSFNQNLSSWNVQGKQTSNMFKGTPMEKICASLPKGITCN